MKVSLRTKRIKATMFKCRKCDRPIKAGDAYYEWKHNHAPVSRQHQEHGAPRRSELCTGKMSGVYAATEALEDVIFVGRADNDPSGLEEALNECASAVREVAEEYESNISNMPDSLQISPTAVDMQEKADALNSFADSLESAAGDIDLELDSEPEEMEDHTDECAINAVIEEHGEADCDNCNCGYEKALAICEDWGRERDDKYDEAFDTADNALGELSI